jgi:hypothetical protein
MLNAELRTLLAADGTPVCNVSFDLSAQQLAACARIVDAVKLARFRGGELSTDDVLRLQEIGAVSDELHRLADHEAHGTVVLPLARFSTLHDALVEWTASLDARGWGRETELEDRPLADGLIPPMASLREQAVEAAVAGAVQSRS